MNRGVAKQKFLHKAEVSILKSLRKMEGSRFSELMRPTGLTSDNFKFYLRNLVKLGWIEKDTTGNYALTPGGKELANNLDETRQTVQRQPKISVLVVASRQRTDGETEYLLQRRLRHPYYGFWGLISGPVQWGESFEETAEAELYKQTGLVAKCAVRSFCRSSDYDMDDELLEDKLFAIMLAQGVRGEISTPWGGGKSQWMTLAKLLTQDKYFPLTADQIRLAEKGVTYTAAKPRYALAEY